MPRSNVRRGALSAVAAAGAIALGFGIAAPASATVNDDGSITVDLLNITDFHGALLTAPNIAQQVATIRDANEDTIFSSAGDSIGGSTFESAVAQDVPTIDVLNDAGLQVSAVGNHEFDQGFPDLRDRVVPRAQFTYLAANVTGQTDLPPYEIITTPNGVDVAYIGTVTDTTPTIVSPGGIEGLTFEDPVETTNTIAAEITAAGTADVIVALVHEGSGVVANGLSADVDVVFTGHSHETRVAATPSGAPVVQAGASGNVLGRVSVTVADDGSLTTANPTNVPVTAMTSAQASSAEPLPDTTFDADSVALVRAAYATAATEGNRPIGEVGADFNAASMNGMVNAGTPQNRGAESPLGNLIAEIALFTVNDFGLDADFGIMNPGGLRADLDADRNGIITFREAFNVTSFSNTIGTTDLTGAQVDTLLEQQFEARAPRPMLALGLSPELTYLYDPTAPIGDRVDAIFLNGAPIEPATTYRVASNTFLLEGADGFTVLGEGTNLQESGVIDWQATANFFAARVAADPEAAPLLPTYLQQSVGVTEVTPLDQVFAPGDEITVDLSSLSFTSTEPQPTEVVATVGGAAVPTAAGEALSGATASGEMAVAAAPGTVLAEVAIDNTIALAPSVPEEGEPALDPEEDPGQGTNETGRASVTVTVPEDTEDGAFTVRYAWATDDQFEQFVELTVAVDAAFVPPTAPEPSNPAPSAPAPSDPSTPPGAGGGQGTLPETGGELAGPALALAALLLLAGLGLVVRRRTAA